MTRENSSPDSNSVNAVKACLVSSVGINVLAFFRGQLAYLEERGFSFTVITNEQTREGLDLPPQTNYFSVPLARSITPLRDILSTFKLFQIFRRERFDLVQYTTPKAALLGSIAAFLSRAPVRLYLMWGIYYVRYHGIRRKLFKFFDWLACRLSTHITFDGFGIQQFAIDQGLCTPHNSSVVGKGGDNGIDISFFSPEKWRDSGKQVRKQCGIQHDAFVIGTVMRLVGDKGINELVAAFEKIVVDRPNTYLLLVGPEEKKDRPRPEVLDNIRSNPRIVTVGYRKNVLPYFAAMDIFVLPTYREGFSAVTLEAAAMCLPVVTTDAIGAGETIVDGKTGFVVPVKNVDKLVNALNMLLDDADLRVRMGRSGRKYIETNFEQRTFWEALRQHREELLISKGIFVRKNGRFVRPSC